MVRAELDKRPFDVAAMFDGVAKRYDLTNDVLAFGQVGKWRRSAVRALEPRRGMRVLDLAAGTGTSAAEFARTGADVVASDFSLGMLREGKRRQPSIPFIAGDATSLPFADETFDAATISFGLRNIVDVPGSLREMTRVLRPGGRLVVLEFSTPALSLPRRLYTDYLIGALPKVARRVSSNPEAYVYLAESIRDWPDQERLAAILREAGLENVQYRNLTGGIVALHRGQKPTAAE